MSNLRKNIFALQDLNVNTNEIARQSGMAQNTVYRILNGEAKIDNISLKNAELLSNYYEENKNKLEGTEVTRFDLVVAKLKAEKENQEKGIYVTVFANLTEYANERGLSIQDTYTDVQGRFEKSNAPTFEQLQEPFILIDESTSTLFEIVTTEEINANTNVFVYYEHNDSEFEVFGEIMTNQSLSVEDALELIDVDIDFEDYEYNRIELMY